jgi:hypothetical protein
MHLRRTRQGETEATVDVVDKLGGAPEVAASTVDGGAYARHAFEVVTIGPSLTTAER